MQLHRATYTDDSGRRWAVMLPEGESNAEIGIPVGPPPLEGLNLPEGIAVILHNELHDRELFTLRDLTRNRQQLNAAIQTAIRLDADTVMAHYRATETEAHVNGRSEPTESISKPGLDVGRRRRTDR